MKSPRCGSPAFSLIELLVSVAVVAVVMAMLFSLSSGAAGVASRSEARLESNASLRSALDRIGYDFGAAVIRDDLPPVFHNGSEPNGTRRRTADEKDDLPPVFHNGSEGYEFGFFALMPGYGGARQLAKIAYRLGGRGLERWARGLDWTREDSPLGYTDAFEDDDFDLLAPGVFAMATEFLMTDGTFRRSPPPKNWSEVRAVAVSLAMVDPKALSRAGWSATDISRLPAYFPMPSGNQTAVEIWSQIAGDVPTLASAGIPLPVAQGISIRRRVFPIR